MVAPVYYTAEMVRALPDDGKRYEVVHGELLVTPAPRLGHQLIVGRLHLALADFLRREPVGQVLMSPADISWDEDTLVQPDVFVAPLDEIRTMDWAQVRTLVLVVEVLSPGRSVKRWTPEMKFPEIVRDRLVWQPAGARTQFVLRLDELFRPV